MLFTQMFWAQLGPYEPEIDPSLLATTLVYTNGWGENASVQDVGILDDVCTDADNDDNDNNSDTNDMSEGSS